MGELYGTVGVLVTLWGRLFVPIQLLLFWLMLFITQLYSHYVPSEHSTFDSSERKAIAEHTTNNSADQSKSADVWYLILVQSAAEVCYTPLMLAGTCVTVSYLSRVVLVLTRAVTAGPGATALPEDLEHSGWTEGVTMALLSVQTSLLSIAMPERIAVLSVILLIVVSSLVQSMYEIVEPTVLSLSAQGLTSFSRHARATTVCLLLLALPLYMVYIFTLIFERDFWLLLVVSASIITSVQVLGLLVTYFLLTLDSILARPWSTLDDSVYYTRATTRLFEFVVAVFVVGAGVKESVIGQWSWINTIVLLIHCYFNVWQRLQQGWKSFLLRLDAARKISALPVATKEQLEIYNDLCSICYKDLDSAIITPCNHYFHSSCLRKWLYVQDKCPMCHSSIKLNDITEVKDNKKTEVPGGDDVDGSSLGPDSIESELGSNIPFLGPENELSFLTTDSETEDTHDSIDGDTDQFIVE